MVNKEENKIIRYFSPNLTYSVFIDLNNLNYPNDPNPITSNIKFKININKRERN